MDLHTYAGTTDINTVPFPVPPLAIPLHVYALAGGTAVRLGGQTPSVSGGAMLDIGAPSNVITSSTNAFFPEYEGLALWNWSVGETTANEDWEIFVLEDTGGPSPPVLAGPVAVTWHGTDDPVSDPSPFPSPPPVITATIDHIAPEGGYVYLSWTTSISPDSNLPIMWYRVFESGTPIPFNPDGTTVGSIPEFTDYTAPDGPRATSMTCGPFPPGSDLTFAVLAVEPVFGNPRWGAQSSVSIHIPSPVSIAPAAQAVTAAALALDVPVVSVPSTVAFGPASSGVVRA